RVFFTPLTDTHVSIRTLDTSSQTLYSPSSAYTTRLYRKHAPMIPLYPARRLHVRRGLAVASRRQSNSIKWCMLTRSFGTWFSPVTSSAQADSTSELLRFL